jgi:hypothetical protein
VTRQNSREPIASRDEIPGGVVAGGRQAGRVRVWADDAEKHRQYRARRRERERLIEELLHAVRNADYEDRALQKRIYEGDDAEILRALIEYYRARYWMLQYRQPSEGSR